MPRPAPAATRGRAVSKRKADGDLVAHANSADGKPRARAKPGHLVLVVGPSGAGKDTLIAAAKRKFRDDPSVVFPRRLITRPEGVGEDHLVVSRREFLRLEEGGAFFLAWTAHGLKYGIPSSVATDLRKGRTVVVNVSREIVATACDLWPRTRVIHVSVALDALRARLDARGREKSGEIQKRINRTPRSAQLPEAITDLVDNSGHLATAVRRFNALLAPYAAPSAKR